MATTGKSFRDMNDGEIIQLMRTCKNKEDIMKKVNNHNTRALNTRLSSIDPIELKSFLDKNLVAYRRLPVNELSDIVKQTKTISEILDKFGISAKRGVIQSLIKYLSANNIDVTHLNLPSSRPTIASSFLPVFNTVTVSKDDIVKSNSVSASTVVSISDDPPKYEMTPYLMLIRDIQISLLRHAHCMTILQSLPLPLPMQMLQEISGSLVTSEKLLMNNVEQLINRYDTERILRDKDKNNKRPLTDILQQNTQYQNCELKKRLLECGHFNNNCSICLMDPMWNGISFEFELDHINGIHSDNRIENLRLVCHNCHSLTPTYKSRNLTYQKLVNCQAENKIDQCVGCGQEGTSCGMYCSDCTPYRSFTDRPKHKTLIDTVLASSYANVARVHKVSDSTIKGWIESYGCRAHSAKYLNVIRELKSAIDEKNGGNQNVKKQIVVKQKSNLEHKPTIKLKSKIDPEIEIKPKLNIAQKIVIKPKFSVSNIPIPLSSHTVANTPRVNEVKKKKGKNTCLACKKPEIYGKYCVDCFPMQSRKYERPPINQLIEEIIDSGYVGVGKKYGVSDNAIKNWVQGYGFKAPTVQELSKHRKRKDYDVFQLIPLE